MAVATLVASPSLVRALIARWYITVPGLLVSLVLAAAGAFVPAQQYSSLSTMVLMPATQKGENSLLGYQPGIGTSAQIIVQTMNDPQMGKELGLKDGEEEIAVVNGNPNAKGKVAETGGPFIAVTSVGPSASRATAIAAQATARIERELADLQKAAKVQARQSMTLTPVVSPTPGKRVWDTTLRTAGLLMLAGCVTTIGLVCWADRRHPPRSAQPAEPAANGLPLLNEGTYAAAMESRIAYLASRESPARLTTPARESNSDSTPY